MNLSPVIGMAVAALIVVSAIGFGSVFYFRLKSIIDEQFVFPLMFCIGMGVMSLLTFALFACGVMSKVAALALILTGVCIFVFRIKNVYGCAKATFRALSTALPGAPEKYAAAATAFFFMSIAFLRACSPPIADDALMYHLGVPKLYLAAGRFVDLPFMVYSKFPLSAEMPYALVLALSSPVAASFIHFTFGIFAALCVALLGVKMSEKFPEAGILAGLIFLSVPLVQWEMGGSYVDLVPCLYILASFILVTEGSGNAIAIAGALAGFAVASKFTAGPYAALLLVLRLCAVGSVKSRIRDSLVFATAGAVPVAPWLVKNWLETGNPVFPFLFEFFGGAHWNVDLHREFLRWVVSEYGMGKNIISFLKLPYNLTFNVANNFGWKGFHPERELGVFYLFFLPLLFVPGRTMRKQWMVTVMAVAGLAIWFFGSQQLRFLLMFWPFVCLLYASKILRVSKTHRIAGLTLAILVPCIFAMTLIEYSGAVAETASAAFASGNEARVNYLRSNLTPYATLEKMDAITAENPGKVAIMMEGRTFYSTSDYVWITPTTQGMVDYSAINDGELLKRRLLDIGVKYLIVPESHFRKLYDAVLVQKEQGMEYSEYFLNFFRAATELVGDPKVEKIYSGDVFSIYRINDAEKR